VASAAGCSVVRTYCGHGIGELFHTSPNVPHYSKNKVSLLVTCPPSHEAREPFGTRM
jgi:methionine aminopeptidase